MFKGLIRSDDGISIYIGLSHANIKRLRQDDPVVFNLKELGLPDQIVAISYKHEGGMAAFPTGFAGVGLAFNDRAIDSMMHDEAVIPLQSGNLKFVVFVGETEQSMESMIRSYGGIGQKTVVSHSGFAPSDVPACNN